jgi:hypothetical protein
MNLISKSLRAINDGGIKTLIFRTIRHLYRGVSKFLPQRFGNYNGVKVPTHSLGESLIKSGEFERPDYEKGIINSMKKNIREDDEVVILGGGIGVTAVTAANLCGKDSKVELFEGSVEQLEKIEKTLKKNNTEAIRLNHAVVGEEKDVWGSIDGAEQLNPSEIPECDVLEMDIEGSEIGVLENLEKEPRVIIVESHGNKGAPTNKVKELLGDLSYRIEDVELAEDRENARKNDIKVITGRK